MTGDTSEINRKLPKVVAARDFKAIAVLSACEIMGHLNGLGDVAGANALRLFVECMEAIPCEGDPE